MSSSSLFSDGASQPIAFRDELPGLATAPRLAIPPLAEVAPASRLEVRPAPEMVSCGIGEIDALTGGLPRGCLTEICGEASSGRTSLLLATLAAATQRQEACALVDVSDAFDPISAAKMGIQFERVLWVRCGKTSPQRFRAEKNFFQALGMETLEQALRVTDLLLQSGGFGLVIIDLGDVPVKNARRIPLTSWFRFQRAVERAPTVLVVVSQTPCTQSCAMLVLRMKASEKLLALSFQLSAKSPAHTQLFEGLLLEGELLRSRLQRKPVHSVIGFAKTVTRTG